MSTARRNYTLCYSWLVIAALSFVVIIGTAWAFQRGGKDFAVFFEAWRLVVSGNGDAIYRISPDRFLYAPGFAWLLAPIGLLPQKVALGLWCLGKAAALGWFVFEFGKRFTASSSRLAGAGVAALGVLILTRPLLIDFQYGQINTFLFVACFWALLAHFKESTGVMPEATADAIPGTIKDGIPWFVLGILSVAKIFPLPLVLVPWLMTSGCSHKKIMAERYFTLLGVLAVLLAPNLTEGFWGNWRLLFEWRAALLSKGLPLESHNQSFSAFLFHFLSGVPTPVIAQNGRVFQFGLALFSLEAIRALSLIWFCVWIGIVVRWIWLGRNILVNSIGSWIAILVGLLVLPSHLVWKPYFVFGIPAASIIAAKLRGRARWVLLPLIFVSVNLSGFDFVGGFMGARLEAGAILLWTHIVLLAITYFMLFSANNDKLIINK